MDVQYGAAVANKFAIFNSDDVDPQKEDVAKQAARKEEKLAHPERKKQGMSRESSRSRLQGKDGSRPSRRQGPHEFEEANGDKNVPSEFRERGDGRDREGDGRSLDEWKVLQYQKRLKATFKIRQAGEGVDSPQWKKGVAYKKKHENKEEVREVQKEGNDNSHSKRKRVLLDIPIMFAHDPRWGGRGSRGGPRGGRGFGDLERDRPTPRGPGESAPRVDDEIDFPHLVKLEA